MLEHVSVHMCALATFNIQPNSSDSYASLPRLLSISFANRYEQPINVRLTRFEQEPRQTSRNVLLLQTLRMESGRFAYFMHDGPNSEMSARSRGPDQNSNPTGRPILHTNLVFHQFQRQCAQPIRVKPMRIDEF